MAQAGSPTRGTPSSRPCCRFEAEPMQRKGSRQGHRVGAGRDPELRPPAAACPTPHLLVSQPDDLRFGVALGSAGEEHGVPRGDVGILGLRRDPGPFCADKERDLLGLRRRGNKDPKQTLYVKSQSEVPAVSQPQTHPQGGPAGLSVERPLHRASLHAASPRVRGSPRGARPCAGCELHA